MLSIIVPTYNVKSYLEECVNSLLAQNYTDCEIIIVDDGSTDGSAQLCDKLQTVDSRIRVVHQKNGGLSAARNTGLRIAQGEYIGFIDSDDLILPSMFVDMIDALEKSHSDVAICNFEVFNKVNSYKSLRYKDEVIDFSDENQVRFFSAALDSSCNRVYRTNIIRKLGLEFEPKNKVAQEDYWFLVRLFANISRIVTVSSCYYKYRERGSSITKSHSDGDITRRCIDFLALAKDYISKRTNKDCHSFMNYAYINMFMASINNASDTKPTTLINIIDSYFKESQFFDAISKESVDNTLCGSGLKYEYDKLCFCLLRHKFIKAYSFLESLRLKKLRSNNRTNLYFD